MKLHLVLPSILFLCSIASAQTVDFRNNQTDYPIVADRDVYNMDGSPLVGTNFQSRLLYGTDSSSLQPASYVTPTRFRNVTTGHFLAGTWTAGVRTLTGFTSNQVVTLVVQVWDSAGGLTFEQARAAGLAWGESAPFNYTVPPPTDLPWAYYMNDLRSFTLVPEPSVFALGAVALIALLARRLRCRH